MAALARRFAILTAARTGEVIGARWSEVDMQAGVWTVPAERVTAGRAHRVPLSDAALTVLRQVAKLSKKKQEPATFVFAGTVADKPLSSMATLMLPHASFLEASGPVFERLQLRTNITRLAHSSPP
jgi:integrase